jgi:hypothetical protein
MQAKRATWLTPGLSFLLTGIPATITPPLAIYFGLLFISASDTEKQSGHQYVNTRLRRVAATVVIITVYLGMKNVSRRLSRRLDRKSLGPDVVEAPYVKGEWPWNLDFIRNGIRARKTGKRNTLPRAFPWLSNHGRIRWRWFSQVL